MEARIYVDIVVFAVQRERPDAHTHTHTYTVGVDIYVINSQIRFI